MTDIISTIQKIEPNQIQIESNINTNEKTALRQLMTMSKESIEIKKEDKSNILAIMDKTNIKRS